MGCNYYTDIITAEIQGDKILSWHIDKIHLGKQGCFFNQTI